MKKDGLIYTVIVSVVSAFIFVFLLSLAYGATKGKVEENQRLTEARAYLVAAGITVDEGMYIEASFNSTFPNFDTGAAYQKTTVSVFLLPCHRARIFLHCQETVFLYGCLMFQR